MMKKTLFVVVALATFTMAFAQEEAEQPKYWKYSGVLGLNANATGMVNWAAGGNNNVAGNIFGKFTVGYEKNGFSWDAKLDIDYGLTFIDQQFDKLQKSSDHLTFDTKLGYNMKDRWFVTVNAAFNTQFDLGRKYTGDADPDPVISNILAPSFTDISVGFDYKPVEFFSLYMSPISGRLTTAYVSDRVNEKYTLEGDEKDLRTRLKEDYGVWHYDKHTNQKVYDSNLRAELGLNIKAALNYKYKDLTLMSNLSLFTPYAWDKVQMYQLAWSQNPDINSAEMNEFITEDEFQALDPVLQTVYNKSGYRDNNRRFGNFDVNWDVTLSYKFLKCLNVTLTTDLRYINGQKIADRNGENARERVQFLGNIGIGVGYSF